MVVLLSMPIDRYTFSFFHFILRHTIYNTPYLCRHFSKSAKATFADRKPPTNSFANNLQTVELEAVGESFADS